MLAGPCAGGFLVQWWQIVHNARAALCPVQVPLDELLDDLEALGLEEGGEGAVGPGDMDEDVEMGT